MSLGNKHLWEVLIIRASFRLKTTHHVEIASRRMLLTWNCHLAWEGLRDHDRVAVVYKLGSYCLGCPCIYTVIRQRVVTCKEIDNLGRLCVSGLSGSVPPFTLACGLVFVFSFVSCYRSEVCTRAALSAPVSEPDHSPHRRVVSPQNTKCVLWRRICTTLRLSIKKPRNLNTGANKRPDY